MSNLIVVFVSLASGGVLSAIVQGFVTRRKSGADRTDVITQAAERAVTVISLDNARLRIQVDGLVLQVEKLTTEIHQLRDQIGELQSENDLLLRKLAEWNPNEMGGG